MKRPNTWLMLCRRLGTPPPYFQLAWARYDVFKGDLMWFDDALIKLFGMSLFEGDNESELRRLVADNGKIRTAYYLIWWHDFVGSQADLRLMRTCGFIEHFDRARTVATCG